MQSCWGILPNSNQCRNEGSEVWWIFVGYKAGSIPRLRLAGPYGRICPLCPSCRSRYFKNPLAFVFKRTKTVHLKFLYPAYTHDQILQAMLVRRQSKVKPPRKGKPWNLLFDLPTDISGLLRALEQTKDRRKRQSISNKLRNRFGYSIKAEKKKRELETQMQGG